MESEAITQLESMGFSKAAGE